VARNRILIADQNPALRQELIYLLQEDSEIVASLDGGERVLDAVNAIRPNVVLLGVAFRGTTGFELARRLRHSNCQAKIIIISLDESSDLVRAALAIGASGYVFISRLLDDLPAAINAVCEGHVFEPKP
jgi:DNA-binding NarL/FixJ family response regulator